MQAIIEVLQPGLSSGIQDKGRFGFRRYGVPQSGAMDQQAAALANLLLQNDPHDAVLEITLLGPELRFNEPAQIVLTGAGLSPILDAKTLENNRIYSVEKGQILKFGRRESGFRAYLAIKGGFQTPVILESRSWCKGVTPYHRLEKGMELPFIASGEKASGIFSKVKPQAYLTANTLEAYPGPEFDLLSASEKEKLQKMPFSAGNESDRMGIQFQEILEHQLEPIITGPVMPGTVQLTPSGRLIALMRDCQTTGGYPRILQLTEKSVDILAQKLPGEKLQIKTINY